MLSFASGVRDAQGARAFVPVGPDSIAAIDIANGTLLWRRDDMGRPIAATESRLVTLKADGKRFALRLVDAATGRDVGRVADFGMPDWAAQIGTAPDAVALEATETQEGIRLAWRLRRPYRGGAPPPSQTTAQMSDERTGAVMLDPDIAQVKPADEAPFQQPKGVDVATDLGPYAKAAPEVLAFERMGDTLFALKARTVSNKTLVSLEARGARDGALLWEVPLSQEGANRPTPQRK